jgi:hypothetical protein
MNTLNKNHLVSCYTQTPTNKKVKKLNNYRVPSLKSIKLKIDQTIVNENKNQNQLKGKKIIKKKKLIDIYNKLYNNNLITQYKIKEKKIFTKQNKHKKGQIALSFGENESENKIIKNDCDIIKKTNYKMYTKYKTYNSNKNMKNLKQILLTNETYKLPIYKVRKILYKRNDQYLSEHSNEDNKTNNINCHINYKDKCKKNLPIITKNKFDSADVKKENEDTLNNLFRTNCLKKRIKINQNLLTINFKNNSNNKKKLKYCLSYGKKLFKKKDLMENNINKISTEINYIKNKVRQLYYHDKTSDNIALSNDY